MNNPESTKRDNADRDEPLVYPAGKARGAEIILKTRTQRIILFGGAAVAALLVLLVAF